jgi:hypothetical protein
MMDLSNQVPGSMGSRNGNVVRGMLQKLGFNTTGTRLFPHSRNGTNVPGTRNVAKFPVPGYSVMDTTQIDEEQMNNCRAKLLLYIA